MKRNDAIQSQRLAIGLVAAVLMVAVPWGVLAVVRGPEITPALRGQRVARALGCFACHGLGGVGGIADLGFGAGRVVGWEGRIAKLYAEGEQDVREWILHGMPNRLSRGPDARHLASGIIPMPAYEGHLSGRQMEDLMAFFRAVAGPAFDVIPEPAYEGWKVADRMGCLGCHGPSGIGGIKNPGSFTGQIPPWDGDQFTKLVRTEDELREWILDGEVRRLWHNWAARYFLEGQVTKMPAYRQHISDAEVDKIVSYVHWIRTR